MAADNARLNEKIVPLLKLAPVTGIQAGVDSAWISMDDQFQVLAVVNGGAVSGSIDVKLQQATDDTGTGAKDITGKAITQITGANETATIECSAYELDSENGFTFLNMQVTTSNAADAVGAVLYGGDKGRYQPSTSISNEDVEQVIT